MKGQEEDKNIKRVFSRVIPYLKDNTKAIILGIVVLIIVDAVQLVIPLIMRKAINGLGTPGFTQGNLAVYMLLIFLMSAVIAVMRYYWRILIIGSSWHIERGLRMDFFNHLIKLSQNFFNKSKIGDLMAHSTNDMNSVRMLFGMGLVAAADIFIMIISAVVFMLSINTKLTVYAILPLPLITILMMTFGKRIRRQFHKVQTSFSDLSGMIQESISGIRVVKGFCQEETETEKMNKFSKEYRDLNVRMAKLSGIFHPSLGFIVSISMIIVLIFGGRATINKDITIGDFVAFQSYLGMLVWPMMAMGWIVEMYQRGTASLNRLNKVFDTKPEIIDEDVDHTIGELHGKLEVKNLRFRYKMIEPPEKLFKGEEIKENELIFDDISFSLDAYKTLAIVGRTGSGKTTIIDLLTRVYNPPKGSIFIDDNDIYSIPLEVLRKNISVVPQDIFLFSDTLANNIRFGRPEATLEEVYEVARIAQVYDEILDFEDKFETIIGERGVTLSGGQKQRIAIARALLADPNILVLDDSLSAIDTKTEKNLLDNLIELRKDKTTIIVAHRISSLQHSDHIIVLDNGKISEEGNHDELLQKKGVYWDLFQKQRLKEKIEGR